MARLRKKGVNKGKMSAAHKKQITGRTPENRYGIIDPISYNIIRTFQDLKGLEAYTGLSKLKGRIHRYEAYDMPGRAHPTIKGFIVVRWTDLEIEGLNKKEFKSFVHEKVRGWMVASQMERMRAHLGKIRPETLKTLFSLLEKIEKDIKITEDEID